jgi:hypothetical protein
MPSSVPVLLRDPRAHTADIRQTQALIEGIERAMRGTD